MENVSLDWRHSEQASREVESRTTSIRVRVQQMHSGYPSQRACIACNLQTLRPSQMQMRGRLSTVRTCICQIEIELEKTCRDGLPDCPWRHRNIPCAFDRRRGRKNLETVPGQWCGNRGRSPHLDGLILADPGSKLMGPHACLGHQKRGLCASWSRQELRGRLQG